MKFPQILSTLDQNPIVIINEVISQIDFIIEIGSRPQCHHIFASFGHENAPPFKGSISNDVLASNNLLSYIINFEVSSSLLGFTSEYIG